MKEMYEIGMFHAFFSTEAWQITIPLWICVALGFMVQYVLLKKITIYARWIFAAVIILLVILCEALSRIINGWDLFGLLIIYGGVFALFIGIIIATITYKIRNR